MSNRTSRDAQQTADQKLRDGLVAKQQTIPSFTIRNVTIKTTDVIATLQQRIDAANAVEPPRATWLMAVQTDRDLRTKTTPTISGVRQALILMFGGSIDTLAAFGLEPRKSPTPVPPVEKVVAVQKALATRKARNTMGPKQKAKIKGTVPATAPAAPPAAPSPTTAATATTVTPRS
jgi:hypothetical protein